MYFNENANNFTLLSIVLIYWLVAIHLNNCVHIDILEIRIITTLYLLNLKKK